MSDEVVRWCEEQLELTRNGINPRLLASLDSGWVVMGETQFLPGYCLLLSREPATALTELPPEQQLCFLADLALVGRAVQNACARLDAGFLRINYEVLGNRWNYLHGHVYARYRWEPLPQRLQSIHTYGEQRHDDRHRLGQQHQPLAEALRAELSAAVASAGLVR